MWKKDNPDSAKARTEARPRSTAGLEGVKGSLDGAHPSPQMQESAPAASPLGAAVQGSDAASSTPFESDQAHATASGGAGRGGGSVPPAWRKDEPMPAEWRPMFRFDGRGGEFFFLLLKNFFLSLITLGIYSFWGKTRQRVYLWSHTHLWGEPLEYTGTGKELFLSFLIVMPVFLVLFFASGILFQFIPTLGPLLFYLVFLFIWQFASYRALRFRLTRTRWRGIRGNMSGSALNYAWKGMLYWLAILFSLGILYPWANARMVKLRMDKVWFGDRRFTFTGPARVLYKSFFVALALGAGVTMLAGAAVAFAFYSMYGTYGDPQIAGQHYSDLFLIVLLFYLALLLLITIVTSFFRAAWFRWFIGYLNTGDIRTRSTLTGGQFFRVTLGNILLTVCTAGLGYAWAYLGNLGVRVNSIEFAGDPDLNSLLQDSQEAPSRGEGLLEVLDVDLGF